MIRLTVEETNLLSIYNEDGKRGLTENINAALPFMDEDMRELAKRTLAKIAPLTENEYAELSLSIKDNGTSIPLSDLPFVFDKGLTGDTGSYLSRSTGMGLYLVQKMATDLFITVELKNNSYGGTTVTLTFPKV